jgi:5'-nucleotidase
MKTERPLLLLTNDDGIDAPGLHALGDALSEDFDLLIVAPHEERSATGHSISVLRDLRLLPYQRNGKPWGWSLEGTPADCVKVAIQYLQKERPIEMVVSGMNRGQNLGINILYSGTVAAAREGVLLGYPAIAYSIVYRDPNDLRFDTGARVAKELTSKTYRRGLPPEVLLNVNIPAIAFEEIAGYAITRQGNSGFRDKFKHVEGHAERNPLLRNVGDRFQKSTMEHHALDDQAIARNMVSISPLHIDTTAHHYLEDLEDLTILQDRIKP